MTKAFVSNQTATRITELLKEQGFEYKKSTGRIIRKFNGGFDVIIFHIVDYRPLFQIEMYLGIRVDAVEEIVNRFLASTFASPEFMRFTETIGTSYMVLSDSKENYIQIESETELGNAIEEMINLIKNKGEIFFKKHKDLGVVNSFKKDQILSDDMGNTHVIHNLMQSLTLMKLCNDPDFDKLKEKYKELYVPFVGEEVTGRKALNDLIEYLQAYNPEKRSQS